MFDDAVGEKRLFRINERDRVQAWYVIRQNDHELVPRKSRIESNLLDHAMRNCGPDCPSIQAVLNANVIGVDGPSGYFRNAFLSQHTGPYGAKTIGHSVVMIPGEETKGGRGGG